MNTELKYWVWLTAAFGPANARKWNTMVHYSSVKEAFEHIALKKNMSFVLPQDKRNVSSVNIEQAEKLIDYCTRKGINIYSFDDADYPDRLRGIYNPPSVLFSLGDIKCIKDHVVIAAVGTRTPSEYSVKISERICKELADSGVVIASGFASGLDSTAINSAVNVGGKAAAVLPCGLLYDYPKDNPGGKVLAAGHGTVISEYFPDDKPTSLSFRARNRLLSGISLGTLVLQAGQKSGALSTASFALSQGKDIFCIPPHELYNADYAGAVSLLRDGAIPVFDSKDILNEYYSVYAHKLNHNSDVFRARSESGLFAASAVKNESKNTKKPSKVKEPEIKIPEMPSVEGLSEDKKRITEFVFENGAVLFDELAEAFEDIKELETLLTEMELEGLLRSLSGNRYSI